ncbi:MAG: hypothetical protein AB1390_01365 [Nitrospirota bacterium]
MSSGKYHYIALNLTTRNEIAELVPNEVRNLALGLLRLRLATSFARQFLSLDSGII